MSKKQYTFGFVIEGDETKGVKALKKTKTEVENLESQINKTKTGTDRWKKSTGDQSVALGRAKKAVLGLAGVAGVAGLGLAINKVINDYRNFETALVGVSKTTGLSGEELKAYSSHIDDISRKIPVTTSELLELSQAAGQMGVTGSRNLEKFSVTIAKLGRASDLAGEEAALSLSRILNVTGESVDSVDVLASVFVSLGNNVAATESEIARMTTEIARSTSAFGVNSAEAAAMAAAMSSIGIRAELGGSAVGRAMQEITARVQSGGTALEDFAISLNLNAETLSALFESNRTDAFQYFLEQVGELGLDAGNALKSVGLGGQEIAKTIIPLSNNMEIFAKTMELANAEVENATALDREFEATLKSFDTQMILAKNNTASYGRAIADEFMPGLTSMLVGFNAASDENFNETVDKISAAIDVAAGASAALAAILATRLVVSVGASGVAFAATTISTLRYQFALASMAGVARGAAVSQTLLATSAKGVNAAMLLLGGPVGATLLAVGAIGYLISSMGTAEEYTDRLRDSLSALSEAQIKNSIITQQQTITSINATIERTERLNLRIAANRKVLEAQQQRLITAKKILQEYNDKLKSMGAEVSANTEKLDENTDSIDNSSTSLGDNGAAITAVINANRMLIDGLNSRITRMTLTSKEQAILTETDKLGADATYLEYLQVVQLSGALYEQEAALKIVSSAEVQAARDAKKLEDASKQAAIEMREEFRATRDSFADFFVDFFNNGKNAFDSLLASFKNMLLKMVAQLLATDLLKLIGSIGTAFSGMGGMLGTVGNLIGAIPGVAGASGETGLIGTIANIGSTLVGGGAATTAALAAPGYTAAGTLITGAGETAAATGSYLASNASGGTIAPPAAGGSSTAAGGSSAPSGSSGSTTLGTIGNVALNIGAGIAGGAVGTSLGESLTGKDANSSAGATVGAAVGSFFGPVGTFVGGAIGGAVDAIGGGDGLVDVSAGLYTNGVTSPDVYGSLTFPSGLVVNKVAQRVDQGAADSIVGEFYKLDKYFTDIARGAGLDFDLSGARVYGKSTNGRDGPYNLFGVLGENGLGDVDGQMAAMSESYVDQLLMQIRGQLNKDNYLAVLDANGASAALSAFSSVAGLSQEGLTIDEYHASLAQQNPPNQMDAILGGLQREGIYGFANGGRHSGGLRVVGERGPELEYTGPSTIFSNRESISMIGGGKAGAESLLGELAEIRAILIAFAEHSGQQRERVIAAQEEANDSHQSKESGIGSDAYHANAA